ncbi:hypothetical protein A2U01_0062732, partial [Trifolium medium]|nr:hypothetical protein [Trifolium medium]
LRWGVRPSVLLITKQQSLLRREREGDREIAGIAMAVCVLPVSGSDRLLRWVIHLGWDGFQAGCQILGGMGKIGMTWCRDVGKRLDRLIEVRTGSGDSSGTEESGHGLQVVVLHVTGS